ncbi:putative zinc-binding protein [Helicovermis profundi]|uniref:putative zinc-binding protein n=1 Tax=Helicovermis profundi TaxID=3065157 RepID=UPI0030D1E879
MKKKKLENIVTENAKKTIKMQHEKFGKTIGINSCAGSSNLGQKSFFIAREIVKRIPNAFMRCPVGLYPEVEGPSQVIFYDDYQVTIDGCKGACLRKTLEKENIKIDLAYELDHESYMTEKKPGPDFDEKKMLEIADQVEKDILKLLRK